MKVGVCLPYMKPGLDRATLLGWARAIEAGPFDAISCGERVTGPTVSLGATMAAAAAVTQRVRIVPTLYVLPMHDAVLPPTRSRRSTRLRARAASRSASASAGARPTTAQSAPASRSDTSAKTSRSRACARSGAAKPRSRAPIPSGCAPRVRAVRRSSRA